MCQHKSRATGGSISANQQISANYNPNRKPPEYAGSDGPRALQNPNKLAEAGLERLLESLGNLQIPPDVVLQVVLSALSKLDAAGREWVLARLQTLSQQE